MSFTKEQADILAGFAKEINDTFSDYTKSLMEKVTQSIAENNKLTNQEVDRVIDSFNEHRNNQEAFVERVIAEVRSAEDSSQARHDAHMKELRIASIATIYASGRGLDTAFDIIEQIEVKLLNP